jgi:ketosteroid isomerase-like protein
MRRNKVNELYEVERRFCDLSAEKGAHEAFLTFIDDSCALLRPNRYPVIGKEKIKDLFNKPDKSYTLSWEPKFADISSSGDLGYTFGIYQVKMDSPEGQIVTKEGTYVTIWKKNQNGEWKFVLDTGNQGLGMSNSEKGE